MIWVQLGASFMAAGILLGAFGAHGLKVHLTPEMMEIYKTGVLYHLIHSLGLILVGLLSQQVSDERYRLCGILLTAGILLFSGTLYALSLSGIRWLGAITPLGGLCFIGGWSCLFFKSLK